MDFSAGVFAFAAMVENSDEELLRDLEFFENYEMFEQEEKVTYGPLPPWELEEMDLEEDL